MDYQKFKYPGTKPINIVLLGDIHYANKTFDKELFMSTVEKLKKEKDIKIVLMGDLIENNTKFSVGNGVYEQTENPNSQILNICKILAPLAPKILCSLRGNHERRSAECGLDSGQYIASSLNVPYIQNMTLTDIVVGKINYRLFLWHGAGSAQSTAGRIKLLERQAETFDADLFAGAHVHELYSTTLPHREVVNGKFKDIFRHYVLTGSFVKFDGSYSEMYGYKMMKLGCPKITLNNKEKEISVDLNYAPTGEKK